jgi:GH18 family chitinase
MPMIRLLAVAAALLGCNIAAGTEKVIGGCYVSEDWGMDKLPVEKIDFTAYNVVFQAFLKGREDGSLILAPGRYPCPELVKIAHRNGAKVLITLGGGDYKLFPQICAKPETFNRFIDGVAEFVEQNDYDGVDLDWESDITPEQGKLWGSMVRALRFKLDQISKTKNRKIYLHVALSCGRWFTGKVDPDILRTQPDFINLMAYDQFSRVEAGYHAALEPAADDPLHAGYAKTLKYLTEELKIPKEKICIGLPFYAYAYENCQRYDKIPKGDKIKKVTPMSWAEIARRTGDWKREYDPVTCAAWFTSPDGKTMIPADDPQSISEKTARAKADGYAGVYCWAMHHDIAMPDYSAPLARAMRQSWEKTVINH